MKIKSAQFIKGIVGPDDSLRDGKPQVAFIGRSNVGKSSLINSLTGQKKLARTSSLPGRTKEINLFLINKSFYLVDLPGYGFAKVKLVEKDKMRELINWYFFTLECDQKKVFLIIDAEIGPTKDDLEMLYALEEHDKNIVIIANKVDKIKKSEYDNKMKKSAVLIGKHKIIPYSTTKNIGARELWEELSE